MIYPNLVGLVQQHHQKTYIQGFCIVPRTSIHQSWFWAEQTSNSKKDLSPSLDFIGFILLMEELLHHLGCKNNAINYLSTGPGILPSTAFVILRYWLTIETQWLWNGTFFHVKLPRLFPLSFRCITMCFFFLTIFFAGGIIREEEFMKDFYAEDLQVTIYHCFRDHVMFYPKNHDP